MLHCVKYVTITVMEEIGIVESIDGPNAKVMVDRKSACKACKEGLCLVSDDKAEIECINSVNAAPGQRVRVVFRPYMYMKGVAIVYGVPILMLFLGAFWGKAYLPEFFPAMDEEILSALGGFGTMIISFLLVRIIANKMVSKKGYHPVIEEILND